jgi:hypothetical protein
VTEPTGAVPEPAGQPAGDDAAQQEPADGDASPAADQEPTVVSESAREDRRKAGVEYKPV